MCHVGGLDHPRRLQFDVVRAHSVEQPDSIADQYGNEVYLYLVEQSGRQALLNGIRAACNRDTLVTRGCLCLVEGAFDSVIDEGECSPALLSIPGLGPVMNPSSDTEMSEATFPSEVGCFSVIFSSFSVAGGRSPSMFALCDRFL